MAFALAVVVVAGVTCATFWDVLRIDFVNWDDPVYVLDNPHVQQITPDTIRWIFTHAYFRSYTPLALVSHAVDYALWGTDPRGHHLTSLVLHAANAVWVLVITVTLLGLVQRRRGDGAMVQGGAILAAGVCAALLWAVHPLRVESVAWVSDRKDLLCGFLIFPAAAAYFRFVALRGTARGRRWYIASAVLCFAALFAKSVAAAFPLLLIVVEALVLHRSEWRGRIRDMIWTKVPMLAATAIAVVIAFTAVTDDSTTYAVAEPTPLQQVLLPFTAMAFYLAKTVWPVDLAPLYAYPGEWAMVALAGAVCALGAIGVALALRGRTGWLAALMTYIIGILPTGALIMSGVQPVADRHSYLASVSLFIMAGGALHLFWTRHRLWPRASRGGWSAAAAVASVVLVLAMAARQQVRVWHDSESLWEHVIHVSPDMSLPYNNLGVAQSDAGRYDEAMVTFSIAMKVDPRDPYAFNNMGIACFRAGDRQRGLGFFRQAVARFRKRAEEHPGSATAFMELGEALAAVGETSDAAAQFRHALTLRPDDGEAYYQIGILRKGEGDDRGAREAFEEGARRGSLEARRELEAKGKPD
jgi:tetratricopeptide (TPR) repeat protein